MFVVAGATGRTGAAVAETLLAAGSKVRAVVRNEQRAGPLRMRGAGIAAATLEDQAALAAAFAGAAGLFLLLPEDPADPEFHARRRRMAEAMASAVRAAAVPHVVFLSTVAAYLAEGNGPARDLHHTERLLSATGARISVVRACYLQENVLTALAPARRDNVFPNFLPSAETPFPTVAAADVGRFAAETLLAPPAQSETIDLFGPEYSVRQMADALGNAIGRRLAIVDVPASAQAEALLRAGTSPAFAEAMAEMFALAGSGRVTPHGDRTVLVTTPLHETLAMRLAA